MATKDPELLGSYWLQAGDTEPMMGREWSPWSFERRVRKLAEVGYTGIGIVHNDLEHLLTQESHTLAGLAEILETHGIEHVELEILNDWLLPEDDYRRQEEQPTRDLLLEAADVFDARHIKIANFNSHPVPRPDIEDRFEAFCAEAAAVETIVGYELNPTDPSIQTLEDAQATFCGPDNGGIYLDSWHMVKMGISNEEISALDGDNIIAAELSDGYVETSLSLDVETVNMRKLAGEGEYDMAGYVDAVRETGYSGPWGHEILSEEYRRFPMDEAYNRAYNTAMNVLR